MLPRPVSTAGWYNPPPMATSGSKFSFSPVKPGSASLLGIILLVPLWPATAAFFTGSLERVTDQSVTVLLSDGRLIDARLPDDESLSSRVLVAKLVFGDQVTIDCISIPPFWDEAANPPLSLGLRTLRFLRRGKPGEMTQAIQSPDWRRPGNLLHPPPGDAKPPAKPMPAPAASLSDDTSGNPLTILERARTVNLDRASRLPNFMADEEVDCSAQLPSGTGWIQTASIRFEVTFNGLSESRQQAGADGEPVPVKGTSAGCIGWTGGFGSYIKPVFDPSCGTTLTYSKTIGKSGKQFMVYNFDTPAEERCFPLSFSGITRAYSAHRGTVRIDVASGEMVSVSTRSRSFPEAYRIAEIEETATWDVIEIKGEKNLLPVSYEKLLSLRNGAINRVSATYTNHRHFEANTKITFQ